MYMFFAALLPPKSLNHYNPSPGKRAMATGDVVTSEDSLFWKLTIKPTQFPANFCESVTRYFETEPERDPCSWQGRWRMSFTENMINGVVTIDIEIMRVRSSSSQEQQQQQERDKGPPADGRKGTHYKTIRLHTPKRAAPALSMALSNATEWDIPLRGKCIRSFLTFVLLQMMISGAA
ncbi:hypothetical protein BGZ58_009940 [Dissophora ornata]|nr:hypothetical protein BGZ58_009940 [Dissophora ornata]